MVQTGLCESQWRDNKSGDSRKDHYNQPRMEIGRSRGARHAYASIRYQDGMKILPSSRRGPLIYALKMGEKWRKVSNDERVRGIHGDFYYEVHPSTPWNYCLIESDLRPNDLQNTFKVVEKGMDGYPWNVENAPVEIHTKSAAYATVATLQ